MRSYQLEDGRVLANRPEMVRTGWSRGGHWGPRKIHRVEHRDDGLGKDWFAACQKGHAPVQHVQARDVANPPDWAAMCRRCFPPT